MTTRNVRWLAGAFVALAMGGPPAEADIRVLVDLYPEWQPREVSSCMLPPGSDVPLPDAECVATDVCWGPASMLCQEVECEDEQQVCCYTGGGTVDCAPVSSPEGMLPYLLPDAPESPLDDSTPEPASWWDSLTEWWGDLWHRQVCISTRVDPPPWWVDVCGQPQPPTSPDLPPNTEDDGEEPPLPPSGCWTTPSGERLCPGEDGRWGLLAEPDLKEACVVEVIDQPVSVENPDGSSAAYLGGCEVETCPGAEPVTTCCTGESLTGHVVCQTVDPAAEMYPYEPHTSIWEALEWLLTLPGSGETPAGYEGPWRFYLFTSATEGR